MAELRPRVGYVRRTVVLAILCFSAYLVNYSLSAWMPSIYTTLYHVPLPLALRYAVLSMAAGFVGATLIALAVDRFGRKPLLATALGGAGVVLTALVLVNPASGMGLAAFVAACSLFVSSANLCLYLYVSELYPTRARGRGAAVAGLFIRLGVLVGPLMVGLLAHSVAGFRLGLAVLAGVAIISAGAVALGEESRGRRLERLSP